MATTRSLARKPMGRPRYLTVRDISEILQVQPGTVYRYVRTQNPILPPPAIHTSHMLRFDEQAVLAKLANYRETKTLKAKLMPPKKR